MSKVKAGNNCWLKGIDKRARRLEGLRDSLLTLNGCRVRRFDAPNGRGNLLKCLKVEGLNGYYVYKTIQLFNRKRVAFAFTMAEILVSLTIIGIIAAITLPSLVGNIKEKSWDTQKKALFSRMTQAISMMPSLNGYGATGTPAEINENAAQAFISDGLSQVLQINNICDSTKLQDCGIPDKITPMSGDKFDFPTNLTGFNSDFTATYSINNNTNVAAFETKNGESIAVFYNPFCNVDGNLINPSYAQPKMCANFVYDLNGRKGPNKVGKDIGVITALYGTNTSVVAPVPIKKILEGYVWSQVAGACSAYDKSTRLPNIEELMSLYYNKKLWNESKSSAYWSGTKTDTISAWCMNFGTGATVKAAQQYASSIRCIKR